jgi:protein involved in polysaccharide export with SLBB domain
MLGEMRAVGRPWPELRDSVLAEYHRQLRNPSVTLTPLRRVQVLGEVTKPGQFLADPTLSLAGLVALAGGATPNGDLRHVRVVRGGRVIVESASVESLLLQAGIHSNDQVFVDRRSWLERNGAFVASAIISTASIAVALIRR